jgi:hypothetical protein
MHSRNLGQLLISPLQPIELILSLMLVSLARTLIGVGFAVALAMPFYDFNLFILGPSSGGLLSQSPGDGLGDWLNGGGAGVALWHGRGKHRLGRHLCA